MIAVARIPMPRRGSAFRRVGAASPRRRRLCILAGANSIFYGDKLLTTANNDTADDLALMEAGLRVQTQVPLMLRAAEGRV